MAGLGRKLFTRGTLASADVQGYLMDQSVMVFASASARTAALAAPSEGMVTYLSDVDRLEWWNGSAWSPVLPRGVARTGAPGTTIPAAGSNETGFGGIAALGNFATYRPGVWLAHYTFRANGAGALATCTVKVNGTQVGDAVLSRSDEHISGHGLVTIGGAGSQSIAARVDASIASVLWSTFRITLQELMAE